MTFSSRLLTLSLLALLSLSLTAWPQHSAAQTTSPTPASLRDSVKQRVDEELDQIKQTVSQKAYLGAVASKTDGNLNLTTYFKHSRTALLTADATIKLATGRDGTPADIKVDDYLLAMGDADGQGTLTIKRLLVVPPPQPDDRLVLFGTVSQPTSGSLTLTPPNAKDYTVKLQTATKYVGDTTASDLKADSKIIVIGTSTSDSQLTARLIHLLP